MAVTSLAHLDAEVVRRDFPLLESAGPSLVYLDSAATSQKPQAVLDAIREYYETSNANVHRGVHSLGNRATEAFEAARERVARFIDADPRGLIFLRNTTEGLNLVATAYARESLPAGSRIVVTELEHHSNFVPWQLAAERAGLELAMIRVDPEGTFDPGDLDRLLAPPTRLVALTHQSNVLGNITPIADVIARAHAAGGVVVLDAAQSVPHMPVSVTDLNCDFLAFSGHKMCGPMGSGVLWGRPALLEQMPPFLGGGSMIERVSLERTTWNEIPHKFEAGTPDVASAVGLSAACDYLEGVGLDRIHQHEELLATELVNRLEELGGITVYGPRHAPRGGAVSFNVADVHPHDVGTIVDREGVAVRAGHHCCQPLMRRLDAPATVRASFYLYNHAGEIDALLDALSSVKRVFSV